MTSLWSWLSLATYAGMRNSSSGQPMNVWSANIGSVTFQVGVSVANSSVPLFYSTQLLQEVYAYEFNTFDSAACFTNGLFDVPSACKSAMAKSPTTPQAPQISQEYVADVEVGFKCRAKNKKERKTSKGGKKKKERKSDCFVAASLIFIKYICISSQIVANNGSTRGKENWTGIL